MHANGTFHVDQWEESTDETLNDGSRITRASVRQTFSGDLEGEGSVSYLMAYRSSENAVFVGLQRLHVTVDGRAGILVMQVTGTFEGGVARGGWTVIPGMGTGALSDYAGAGSFQAPHGPDGTYELTLERASMEE
jgi:hypothetical protein